MTDATTTETKPKAEKKTVDPKVNLQNRLAALTQVAEPVVEHPAIAARKQVVVDINGLVANFVSELEQHLGNNLNLVDPATADKGLASLEQARRHFVKSVASISDDNYI